MDKKFRTHGSKSRKIPLVTDNEPAKTTSGPGNRASRKMRSVIGLGPILEQMKTNTKKILITTESREVFIIRQIERARVPGFCVDCEDEVGLMSFDAAVSHSGLNGRELMVLSQAGDVHSVVNSSGHLLICDRSLRNAVAR